MVWSALHVNYPEYLALKRFPDSKILYFESGYGRCLSVSCGNLMEPGGTGPEM